MALVPLIDYDDATPEVRAVYDDIRATRRVDWINNFWKALANDPATLARVWASVKSVMAPGAIDALVDSRFEGREPVRLLDLSGRVAQSAIAGVPVIVGIKKVDGAFKLFASPQ